MLRNYIKRMQDAVSDYANNRICGNEIDACIEVWNISIDALDDMIETLPSYEDKEKLKELYEESKEKYNHPKFDWILHKLMKEWDMEIETKQQKGR